MPSKARARNLAAIIIANGGCLEPQARWEAVPQSRKDNLERFLERQRKNPLGPVLA